MFYIRVSQSADAFHETSVMFRKKYGILEIVNTCTFVKHTFLYILYTICEYLVNKRIANLPYSLISLSYRA